MACRSPGSRGGRSLRRPLELAIDSLAFGGDGVGRDADGRVVFVPLAAPGDRVEVALSEEKKGFARGEILRVLASGPLRVAPPCPVFGSCGGCQWQHVSYPAQLAAKAEIVARALRAEAGAVLEPALGSPATYGYRRRVRLTMRPGHDGGPPVLGFRARRSHEVVDVKSCPLCEPGLNAALAAVRDRLVPALGRPCTIELLAGDRVHVAVDVGGPEAEAAAAALIGRASIAGVTLAGVAVGAPGVLVEGVVASASGFAQAQREQNLALRELVAAWAEPAGARVLELYAGAGNLTKALAAAGAAEIEAVEEDAAQVAAAAPLPGVRFRVARAEDAVAGSTADVLVLDPPRTGALEVVRAVAAASALARIVYVSCDPMTLARDVAVLTAAGWRLERARALDMMPQTFHIEVVAKLVRA